MATTHAVHLKLLQMCLFLISICFSSLFPPYQLHSPLAWAALHFSNVKPIWESSCRGSGSGWWISRFPDRRASPWDWHVWFAAAWAWSPRTQRCWRETDTAPIPASSRPAGGRGRPGGTEAKCLFVLKHCSFHSSERIWNVWWVLGLLTEFDGLLEQRVSYLRRWRGWRIQELPLLPGANGSQSRQVGLPLSQLSQLLLLHLQNTNTDTNKRPNRARVNKITIHPPLPPWPSVSDATVLGPPAGI